MALIEMIDSMPALEGDARVWDRGQLVNVSDELAIILCSEPEDHPRAVLRDDLTQSAEPAEPQPGGGEPPPPAPEPGPGTTSPGPRRGTRRVIGPQEAR